MITPKQEIFEQILHTRPTRIRLLSYNVFKIFWKAIGLEERKLRERTDEMETILNGIQDFILVITPEMEIIECNESFLTKMRYTRDDVIVIMGQPTKATSDALEYRFDYGAYIAGKAPNANLVLKAGDTIVVPD